jgi:hypothetical protein
MWLYQQLQSLHVACDSPVLALACSPSCSRRLLVTVSPAPRSTILPDPCTEDPHDRRRHAAGLSSQDGATARAMPAACPRRAPRARACASSPRSGAGGWGRVELSRAINLCDQALRMIEGARATDGARGVFVLRALCDYDTMMTALRVIGT